MRAAHGLAALALLTAAACAPHDDDASVPPPPAASFSRMLIDPQDGPVLRVLQQDFPTLYGQAQARLSAEVARGASMSALEDDLHAVVLQAWAGEGAKAADASERRIRAVLDGRVAVLAVLHAADDKLCARYVLTGDWGGWAPSEAARQARAEADLAILQAIAEGRQGAPDRGLPFPWEENNFWYLVTDASRNDPDRYAARGFGSDRDADHEPAHRCAVAMNSARGLSGLQDGAAGRLGARYIRALAAGAALQPGKPQS